MYSLLLLNFIIPFVMVLVGGILKKRPTADIKSSNGYSTPTSRKSQEHWNYAQIIAPNIFISLGKALCIIEIILNTTMFILQVSINLLLIIGIGVGIIFLFFSFYKTDLEIKKKFVTKK